MCDLETSRIGAPYIYDISRLRVKVAFGHFILLSSSLVSGAFAKGTINFALSVCPFTGPHETTRLPLIGFSLNLVHLNTFLQSVEEARVSLKSKMQK